MPSYCQISALLIASASTALSIPFTLSVANSEIPDRVGPQTGWSSALDRDSAINMGAVRVLRGCLGCSSTNLAGCTACLKAEVGGDGSPWPSGSIIDKQERSVWDQSSFVVIVPSTEMPPRRGPGEPWISLLASSSSSNNNNNNNNSSSSSSSGGKIEGGSWRDDGEALIDEVEEAGRRIEEMHGERFDMSIKVKVDYAGSLGGGVAAMFLEQDSTLVISPLAFGAASDTSHAAHQLLATSSGSAHIERSAARSAWLASSTGGVGQFPVKCYMCIVAMGTAVPLGVNVLLQDIAKGYCDSKGMSPEECDPIRFSEFRPSNSLGGQCRFIL